MATMQMYCPSLKKNVKATITDGKRVASKGGSLRNILYGEYEGRRCLPKTVKAEVFAQHGFAAESEGESATYEPSQEPEGSTPAMEPTNANFEAEGDWCPECNRDWKHIMKEGHGPDCSLEAETESFCSSCGSHKRAEGCGCKSAESEEMIFCDECEEEIGTREEVMEDEVDSYKVERNGGVDVLCYTCYQESPMGSFNEDYDAETFEAEKSTCRCGKDIANPKCKMCGSSICSDCDWQYANKCIECFGSHFNAESSPSSFDISWEDAQGVSSPSLPPEGIHFAEQGKNIKFCNGCNKRTNFEDGECNFCAFPEFGAEEDYHLNGETCEHCAEEVQLNAEGFCSECYEDLYLSETMAAEGISRNGKLVLGLAALGVGMAMALGSEKVASLLDKFNRK